MADREPQDAERAGAPRDGDGVEAVTPPSAPAADESPPTTLRLIALLLLVASLLAGGAYALGARGGASDGAESEAGAAEGEELRGFILEPAGEAPGFALTDDEGRPFELAQTRGEVVLLFFGFTYCPDVCPQTLAKLSAGLGQLPEGAEDVRVLFVTVDPERDTPEQLARYLEGFELPVVGLTGELPAIEAIAADYGVHFQKDVPEGEDAGEDYSMIHSSTVFLIDRDGRLRAGMIDPPPEDVAHDLGILLAEG